MTDFRQAASHAKNLAKQFRGVMEIADALEEIGNFEAVRVEAEKQAMKAREAFAKASFELARVKDQLVKIEDHVEIARDEAVTTGQETQVRLKKLIEEAEVDAAQIIAKAHEQAEKVREEMKIAITSHNMTMVDFAGEERKAKAQIEIIQNELAELRKRIE